LAGGASPDLSYRFAGAASNATFFLGTTRGRMALNIKSAETDRLVRELAALTGESITEAVTRAVELRLQHERQAHDTSRERLHRQLRAIQAEFAQAPILDDRTPDELLGYNEHGTFE
jgi:antitoxin VapB